MADKKPSPKPPTHPAEPVIVTFFIVALLSSIFLKFSNFLDSKSSFRNFLDTFWLFLHGGATIDELFGVQGSSMISDIFFYLKVFSFAFSAFMIWMILLILRKYKEADKKLREPIKPPKEVFYGIAQTSEEYANPKWKKVLEHVNSSNPADWKLAILEADIILNEMLDKMGYHGATMGDKLKSIEPSDFTNLQEAWEAHKIRNSIAHEGSDYVVSKPEAERVIRLFEKVFKEFKFI